MPDLPSTTFEEAPRPALVCVDAEERQHAATTALEELGYTVDVAASAEEAIERMRKIAYLVIIVDETYDGAAPLDNAVLKALGAMSMSTRRYIFVLLLGSDVVTL